jgi:hypothetical protein
MYDILIAKLEEFIRKYYLNQLYKGLLYAGAVLFSAFLLWVVAEYFAHFGQLTRGVMFYGFLLLLIFTLGKWVAIPLAKINRLGETMNYEQASRIIGNHFTTVQDKLLNIIHLQRSVEANPQQASLVLAGIDQKIAEIGPTPFHFAIDFRANRKYIKYALVPALVLLVMALTKPEMVLDPSERIVRYNEAFAPQAPFRFVLDKEVLQLPKNENAVIKLRMEGDLLPAEVNLLIDDRVIGMARQNRSAFTYTLNNVQENTPIQFSANGFMSETYTIEVLPNPLLLDYTVKLNFPAYLNLPPEEITNTGDLQVPEGTKIEWHFLTESTDELMIDFETEQVKAEVAGDDKFIYKKTAKASERYTIQTANEHMEGRDEVQYQLNVIADAFPEIAMWRNQDSLNPKLFHCIGEIEDDYGLNSLSFNYRVKSENKEEQPFKKVKLKYEGNKQKAMFYYALNINDLGLNEGDEITYYFEVGDNDGVNGSKYSRTPLLTQLVESSEQLAKGLEKKNDKLKEEIEEAIKTSREVRKELAELNKAMLEKKSLTWQDKEKIEALMEKQESLKKSIKNIEKKYERNNEYSKEIAGRKEEILEKQELLEKLFEELLTEEMKDTMEKIEELLSKMNKEELQKETEKMELSAEDLEKELDRSLELLKQMEVEEKLDRAKEKLDKLKEEQEKLAKSENKSKEENEEELKKQIQLNKEFSELRKEMEELREKNDALEFPNEMKDTEQLEEKVAQEMKESSESLERNKGKKADEMQESAKEGMEEMSEALADMQMQMQQQQAEDLNALRQLLDNIITSSFDQEGLMDEMEGITSADPNYVEAMIKQKGIRDNVQGVEDSLFALSKRVPQLQSVVNKEINLINHNIDGAIKEMQERRTGQAMHRQQMAMTSLNNLGLLLDEAVQQMQQQMASQMSGSGSCKKPGGKSPKSGAMSEMQKALNQQLKDLQKAMQEGGGKPGGQGKGQGPGGKEMGKELAKMAAKQAALREELRKMANGQNGGKEMGDGKKLSDLMEQTETDIVNKRITRETIRRQEEILTRLLESEKAEREREWDDKRESTEGVDREEIVQKRFLEYHKESQKEIELLRTMLPSYNEFYKKKVSEYFKALSE